MLTIYCTWIFTAWVHAKLLQLCQLFVTLWTLAHQAPLFMEILQARILEWVAIPSSRGSSQPRDSNPGLLHCRQPLYHLSPQGAQIYVH